MIEKVSWKRIANDVNKYLIALFKYVLEWGKLEFITKEEWESIKFWDKDSFEEWKVWYAGFIASFNWLWFQGYSWIYDGKHWYHNYQEERIRSFMKQVKRGDLQEVQFECKDYRELEIPANSIIYVDAPYRSSRGDFYIKLTKKWVKDRFDYESLYKWLREKKDEGHTIFISEYEVPEELWFKCIWEKPVNIKMATNKGDDCKTKWIEKLFIME